MKNELKERIESELEVDTYIQRLKYALNNGAQLVFQAYRRVDDKET